MTRRLGLLALFIGVPMLLLLAAPSDWAVTRTIGIAAGPHEVYREAADLHRWDTWTAWSSRTDPAVTRTFGGALMGKGASMTWAGPRLGNGTVTVTEADPLGVVGWRTEADDGAMSCRLSWAPHPTDTDVTWTCHGNDGPSPAGRWRAFHRDATLGPELEAGLVGLKAGTEAMNQASQADRAAHPRPPRSRASPAPLNAEGG